MVWFADRCRRSESNVFGQICRAIHLLCARLRIMLQSCLNTSFANNLEKCQHSFCLVNDMKYILPDHLNYKAKFLSLSFITIVTTVFYFLLSLFIPFIPYFTLPLSGLLFLTCMTYSTLWFYSTLKAY